MKKIYVICRMHSEFRSGHKIQLNEIDRKESKNEAIKVIRDQKKLYPNCRFCIIEEIELID